MDMDFKGANKPKPNDEPEKAKNLPGFRGSSELPEFSEASTTVLPPSEKESSISSSDTSTDPTDLTLERERGKDSMNINLPKNKKPRAKKKQIIILLIILGVVIAGAAGWIVSQRLLDKKEKSGEVQTSDAEVKKIEKPATVAAPITGRDVSPEIAARSVTAVMIENSVEARPQAGLYEADMVVEAVAEGGVTRFVTFYQEGQPASIGPIRSARPYYVDLARTFDAAYVHAGGSDDALARISELGIKDMSAFENNGTYIRVSSKAAPHNLYSSTGQLDARKTALGYTTSAFTSWGHKNETPQTPTATAINFAVSSYAFNPSFNYDAASNSYLRSQAGEAHTDESSGKQLNPKVVIALITSKGQNGIYSTYRLTGTGDIRVFQDGIVSEGTWTKESATSQFVFRDKNGLEFKYNKGQAWVTLLGSTSDIIFTP
jgi:hypothetical protein